MASRKRKPKSTAALARRQADHLSKLQGKQSLELLAEDLYIGTVLPESRAVRAALDRTTNKVHLVSASEEALREMLEALTTPGHVVEGQLIRAPTRAELEATGTKQLGGKHED